MDRILLVEDDASLGPLIQGELGRAGYDCAWARNAFEALARMREGEPALVLLDLNLPDHSGFEVLAEIRRGSHVPVIILTARNLGEDKVKGLDLGADDYLTKPFWNEELLARIRARLRRGTSPAPPRRRLRFGEVLVDLDARTVEIGDDRPHLTRTEFDLLAFLIERSGRSVRRQQLIDDVLQGEDATETALQTHLSRLRGKLGAAGQSIHTVWGIGYRLDADVRDA